MAKIRSGILGNLRGKVSGVVGSQWKDVNYLREYVKPANPNTAAQQVQRTKMSDAVTFCKPLVGPVFNAYTDKFQKSMSGFNRFIKSNIAVFDGTPDLPVVKLTEGSLFPLATFAATYNTADGEVLLSWDKAIGNNGDILDHTYAVVYHEPSGLWYFAPEEELRDDEADLISLPAGLTATDVSVWTWAARVVGSVVTLISDSVYDLCAAP
jgi:hypothetical protein